MSGGALVPVALSALAGLDGLAAGLRASWGRTGLVRHGHDDIEGALRGLGIVAATLAPVCAATVADVALDHSRFDVYVAAGSAMLTVFLPYGAVVLAAVVAFFALPWRYGFLASALLLGPCTLVRPLVAVAGALNAAHASHDVKASLLAAAAVLAVLAVEPIAGRRFRDSQYVHSNGVS